MGMVLLVLKVWDYEVNGNEFDHFHISNVGMDPTRPCKQKVIALFRSCVVPFYDLLFCVMLGGILNATSIYLIRHCLLIEAVHSSFVEIAACCWAFCRIDFADAELWWNYGNMNVNVGCTEFTAELWRCRLFISSYFWDEWSISVSSIS